MNSVEDRIRAATRASGTTVRAIRPLSLPPSPAAMTSAAVRRPRRWVLWAAPVTAAVAVVAIALSLALARPAPNAPSASPAHPLAPAAGSAAPAAGSAASAAPPVVPGPRPTAPSPAAAASAAVPGYYVAPGQSGGHASTLVVRSTFTGAVAATVRAPAHYAFTGVGGSPDDRTFVVLEQPTGIPLPSSSTEWFLLRIAPGTSHPASLTRLSLPVTPYPQGFALSPDGRDLAMAAVWPGTAQDLRLYSVASGKLLRTWSSSARAGLIGAYPSPGESLTWLDGGTKLAFVYGGSVTSSAKFNWTGAIRVLDVTAPGTSLTADSTTRLTLGPAFSPEGPLFSCDVLYGWTISDNAQTVTCAGVDGALLPPPTNKDPLRGEKNCGTLPPAGVGFTQDISLSGGGGAGKTPYAAFTCSTTTASVYLAWSQGSGTVLVGSVTYGTHHLFGVFRGTEFTPLPATQAGIPLTSIAW